MGSQVMSLWWVLAGALCIVVLWVFLSRSFNTPVNPTSLEEPDRLTINEDLSDFPIAEFVAPDSEILPEIVRLLREQEMDDVLVVVGGIIPEADRQTLLDLGVSGVFGPGTSTGAIVDFIVDARQGQLDQ